MSKIERPPMETFSRAYAEIPRRLRPQLRISTGDGLRHFLVDVLGVNPITRNLLLTAPTTPDGALVAVMRNQALSCRWNSPVSVYGFRALIANLGFDPIPVIHLGQLHAIKRYTLRRLPRVATAMPASVSASKTHAALVTDLSTGGAQIGVGADLQVQVGEKVELVLRPQLVERNFVLKLQCSVATVRGNADATHPTIFFYGLVFIEPDELSLLTLHGCVQGQLLEQSDQLGKLLQPESVEVDRID